MSFGLIQLVLTIIDSYKTNNKEQLILKCYYLVFQIANLIKLFKFCYRSRLPNYL